ncbi:MAG: ferrous iron transport protein B [Candidatus Cloacimonadota bacterium]|nr:MAG: ferrous iron transport protein B [Candidatus Cloacimonadota bacterium]
MECTLDAMLVGNPNCGKTSFFNALCGTHARVGNYAGVTVEKKTGLSFFENFKLRVTDLPGTYSLNAVSLDEKITLDYLLSHQNQTIINILDGTNLERNLFLSLQLIELNQAMVLVVNMQDEMASKGLQLDIEKLQGLLGVPIVSCVATKKLDKSKYISMIDQAKDTKTNKIVTYPKEIIEAVEKLAEILPSSIESYTNLSKKWFARKLLEKDQWAIDLLSKIKNKNQIEDILNNQLLLIKEQTNSEAGILITQARYSFSNEILSQCITKVAIDSSTEDKIDEIIMNRFFGLPIFFFLVYLSFQLVFTLGDYPMGWIEDFFAYLSNQVLLLWPKSSDFWLKSLIVDGVIAGCSGVLIFLPNIIALFLCIAIFEGSGYMARASFLMDKLMQTGGLNGKSFLPMSSGLGCTVPAIMATRVIENSLDRFITIMVLPLVSCMARLPIYGLLIPIFFSLEWRGFVLFIIYLLGIVVAGIVAKILKSTMKQENSSFIMEIPPLRLPSLRFLWIQILDRSKIYLSKVGTTILAASIVLWFLGNYPNSLDLDSKISNELSNVKNKMLSDKLITDFDVKVALSIQSLMKENETKYWEYETAFTKEKIIIDNELKLATKSQQKIVSVLKLEQKANTKSEKIALDLWLQYQKNILNIEDFYRGKRLEHSILGKIGKFVEPVFTPVGFDWKITTALLGAIAAKEVFVSQFGIVFGIGEADVDDYQELGSSSTETRLSKKIKSVKYPKDHKTRAGEKVFNPLVAVSLMIFCLISAPCMATVATVIRETNSYMFGMWQFCGLSIGAYLMAFIVYQTGIYFNIGLV